MVKLVAKSAADGLLPLSIGDVTVTELAPDHVTSIGIGKGQKTAISDALKAAHGMALPAPNRATGKEGARCVWFGHAHAMLIGPALDASVEGIAATTDQSDSWICVRIEGAGAADVLARLTPIDLRDDAFKRGHTARTELAHMAASITRTGANAYDVMVFRSMAGTLVHDLETVMKALAARG